MSETTTGSGAPATQSGASVDDKNVPPVTKPETQVSWADHKRVQDDMHKFKKEAQDAKNELKTLETKKLQEAQDFKTLYERTEASRVELETKHNKFKESFIFNHKFNSVHSEALKSGLRTEAESDLNLLDLEGVAVETTSEGRVLINGAKEYVENLKKTRPHWFEAKQVPRVNAGGSGSPPDANEPLTAEYINRLEKTDPKKYRELLPKFIEQRRKAV